MKTIRGVIQKGSGQAGNLFGLPTANVSINSLPEGLVAGVYASRATVNEQSYQALTFIGQAHLLPGKPWRLETHLFSANGDFTGQQLSIQLLHHQRDAMLFTSNEQAAAVIRQDVADARTYFANNPT